MLVLEYSLYAVGVDGWGGEREFPKEFGLWKGHNKQIFVFLFIAFVSEGDLDALEVDTVDGYIKLLLYLLIASDLVSENGAIFCWGLVWFRTEGDIVVVDVFESDVRDRGKADICDDNNNASKLRWILKSYFIRWDDSKLNIIINQKKVFIFY